MAKCKAFFMNHCHISKYFGIENATLCLNHRLSIIRPTKHGKERSLSDGHCQCQKEMDEHLLACQQFLTESHIVTRLGYEQVSLYNMNNINDIYFFGTSDCYVIAR
jgi:hypothetical protein